MRLLGIILLIGGLAMIGGSIYINEQVIAGKEKISSAQQTMDLGNKLFSINPTSKQVGDTLMGSSQKKIDEGKQKASHYADLAHQLKIGGIVTSALGLGTLILALLAKKRKAKQD